MAKSLKNSALLVMDMQAGILRNLPDNTTVVNNVYKAITTARENAVPVIYVVAGFRPGLPEINMNNKAFAASKERFANTDMNEFMKIEGKLASLPDDVTVVKRRFSAFTGSDLEVILRAKGIQHIVLTGVSTSGVVLSTLREAADKDYQISVLSDCCADPDDEVHRVLITKIFPRQADVLTVQEWK